MYFKAIYDHSHRATFVRTVSLTFLLGFVGAFFSACFVDSSASANFRFSCKDLGDCDTGEACIDGLCQLPCTGATADNTLGTCPSTGDYAACINGTCASVCSTSDDACPAPQTCVALPDVGASSSQTGGVALCMVPCMDAATDCSAQEICLQGFCLPSSTTSTSPTATSRSALP